MEQDDVVSFEVAKLAKEAGFDYECMHSYKESGDPEGELESSIDYTGELYFNLTDMIRAEHNTNMKHYLAPFEAQLLKWLREKHNIIFEIESYRPSIKVKSYRFKCRAKNMWTDEYLSYSTGYSTYSGAIQDSMIQVLKEKARLL